MLCLPRGQSFLINKVKFSFIKDPLVKMRVGGLSNKGLGSMITITKEMKKAFKMNNKSSFYLFLLFRLPIKFMLQILPVFFNRMLRFTN